MVNGYVKPSTDFPPFIHEVNLGATEASLPGGSAAGALFQIVAVGEKVGMITGVPTLGADGNFWATIDAAALVRVQGVAGTATDGQVIYITSANAVTLTVGSNRKIGFVDKPKLNTGDDVWVRLVPGSGA